MAGIWNGVFYNGDATNEAIVGTAAAEVIYGGDGDDQVNAQAGNDTVFGGYGSDALFGGIGDDRLIDLGTLSSGFVGLVGRDSLFGGNGDDTLQFLSVDTGDIADGGAGNDHLIINFAGMGLPNQHAINFTLGFGGAASVVQLNGINTLAVSNIERITFFGHNGNDFISGAAGDDSIYGGDGNDVLAGGAGNDLIDGGKGIQDIDGGAGTDTVSFDISGLAGPVLVENAALVSLGAAGTIRNAEVFGFLQLGAGADRVRLTQTQAVIITGGGGGDDISTGAGNDSINFGAGANTARLGAGNDFLTFFGLDTASDSAFGGAGTDALNTGDGDDLLRGGDDRDLMFGGGGDDRMFGDDGDDNLSGQNGADALYGGLGNDSLDSDRFGFGFPTAIDADRLYGGEGNDTLTFGRGADIADGGAGDDFLSMVFAGANGVVDTGLDRGDGGLGTDILQVNHSTIGFFYPAALTITLGTVSFVRFEGALAGRFDGIEQLSVTTVYNSNHDITGGGLSDSVRTAAGDDVIRLGGGDDLGHGDAGSDTILAGAGDDYVSIMTGGADLVRLGTGADHLLLFAPFTFQTLTAGTGVYAGEGGTDLLELRGANRAFSFDGAAVVVDGLASGTVNGFESLSLVGSTAQDIVTGLAGDDRLVLQTGDDSVDGGAGADSISDGDGTDTLTGGSGADLFDLARDADNDSITDFEDGADLIRLAGSSFAALTIASVSAGTVTITLSGEVVTVSDGGAGLLTAAAFSAADFQF